jgi:hypothetical protein
MSRIGAVAVCTIVAFAVLPSIATAKRIGSAHASGDYATAVASGNAHRPHSIKVRITSSPHQRATGSWSVVCSKGSGAGSKSGDFHGRTTFTRRIRLPMHHPDDCSVAASAQLDRGGHLKVTLFAH